MRKWTEDLLALQSVDLRIRGLKTKLATIPSEKLRLNIVSEEGRVGIKSAKENLQKVELQIKGVEASIAQVNAEIVKLQNQSMMVKKNDEYQAMLKQVEDCKAKISDFETSEIELLDKVEAAKQALKIAEKSLVDRERSVKSELQEFVQLEADIKAEIDTLLAGRSAYEKRIEQNTLSIYNPLINRGKGEAVAKVKDGGHCSNCLLKLTPQTLSQAKGGVIALCDNCSHIVYMDVPDHA